MLNVKIKYAKCHIVLNHTTQTLVEFYHSSNNQRHKTLLLKKL